MHHLHVSFTILQYTVFVLYVGTESLEWSNVQSKVNNNTQIISQNTVNLKNKFMFDKKRETFKSHVQCKTEVLLQ